MLDPPGIPSRRELLTADWLYLLNTAESEMQVVGVARDFVATWSPLEISRLPASSRPGRLADEGDVSDLAYRLTRAHLTYTGSVTDWLLLERMMNFFVQANTRIGELHAAIHARQSAPF
jgi:hypothetical protein